QAGPGEREVRLRPGERRGRDRLHDAGLGHLRPPDERRLTTAAASRSTLTGALPSALLLMLTYAGRPSASASTARPAISPRTAGFSFTSRSKGQYSSRASSYPSSGGSIQRTTSALPVRARIFQACCDSGGRCLQTESTGTAPTSSSTSATSEVYS